MNSEGANPASLDIDAITLNRRLEFSLLEIAAVLRLGKSAVEKRAKREAWPFVESSTAGGRYKQRLFERDRLPEAVALAIVARQRFEQEREAAANVANDTALQSRIKAAWDEFGRAKGWRIKIAERRQSALFQVAALQAQGLSLRNARVAVVEQLRSEGVTGSDATLKRWGRMVKGLPRMSWLAFLLPEENGRPDVTDIHPDAWVTFKWDWLRPEKPTAAACYRRVQRHAKNIKEWNPLPSLKTFERRIQTEIPPGVRMLGREGKEALARMGPKIERDRSGLHAMQSVNSDGHVFDVAVEFPDGTKGRPVIVGWQDIASGKLLSYRIGKSETADLVRLSFCDMVRDYGIPEHATLDNGRAYASKKNTGGVPTRYRYKVKEEDPQGVLTRLGVDVHWVTPYNGKAKPIERAWRDLAQDLSKREEFAGAYLGNKPTEKPENYGSRTVPFAEFVRVVADGVAEHNARIGRRAKVCNGRSFDETFAASYATAKIIKASAAQLSMLLLAADVVTVNRNTGDVTLANNRYWSEALCAHMGLRVELRFDPEALHAGVHAFELGGEYIGEVPCIHAMGFETSDKARDAQRAQKRWLKANKELMQAEKAREEARRPGALPPIPEPDTPRAAVVQLHIPKRKPKPLPQVEVEEGPSDIDKIIIQLQAERVRNSL